MRSSSGRDANASSAPEPVVLFEDNHLIVVHKPFGMPTQGDLSGDLALLETVKSFLKKRDAKPGNVYLGLVHRLDRPVAGLVVFAKTSKAAGRLSEQFRERSIRKIYRAVVDGVPQPREASLEHFVGDLAGRRARLGPLGNKVAIRSTPAPGFKPAQLNYRVLDARGPRALLEIVLGTGRKHQIRAQLAAIGCPIVGDRKYGGPELSAHHAIARARGIALLAARLELHHPVRRDETIVIEVPPALDPLPELLAS